MARWNTREAAQSTIAFIWQFWNCQKIEVYITVLFKAIMRKETIFVMLFSVCMTITPRWIEPQMGTSLDSYQNNFLATYLICQKSFSKSLKVTLYISLRASLKLNWKISEPLFKTIISSSILIIYYKHVSYALASKRTDNLKGLYLWSIGFQRTNKLIRIPGLQHLDNFF